MSSRCAQISVKYFKYRDCLISLNALKIWKSVFHYRMISNEDYYYSNLWSLSIVII